MARVRDPAPLEWSRIPEALTGSLQRALALEPTARPAARDIATLIESLTATAASRQAEPIRASAVAAAPVSAPRAPAQWAAPTIVFPRWPLIVWAAAVTGIMMSSWLARSQESGALTHPDRLIESAVHTITSSPVGLAGVVVVTVLLIVGYTFFLVVALSRVSGGGHWQALLTGMKERPRVRAVNERPPAGAAAGNDVISSHEPEVTGGDVRARFELDASGCPTVVKWPTLGIRFERRAREASDEGVTYRFNAFQTGDATRRKIGEAVVKTDVEGRVSSFELAGTWRGGDEAQARLAHFFVFRRDKPFELF